MKKYTIVTHRRPHLDEVVAIFLLLNFGNKKFPGIENARIEFWNSPNIPDNKSWEDWYKKGYILVGVGGSPYDEHPSNEGARRENECAATLVAKSLKIDQELRFKDLLAYTLQNDTTGGKSPYDLAALITLCNKTYFDKDPQGSLEWAMQAIEWHVARQTKFFNETKKEFDEKAKVFTCSHYGRDITVVAGQTDDEDFGAYSRSPYGANADVTIVRNSKGSTFIITKKKSGINVKSLVKMIRTAEMLRKKTSFQLTDLDLEKDGVCIGSEEWYFDSGARWILNGSQSNKEVAPSKISLEDLIETTKDALNIEVKREVMKAS